MIEQLIETVLAGLQLKICLIHIDNMIVCGRTFEEAFKILKLCYLKGLCIADLKLKAQKCRLFRKYVSFLGHIIFDSKDQGCEGLACTCHCYRNSKFFWTF